MPRLPKFLMLATVLVLSAQPLDAQSRAPALLFVYKGAGCTGRSKLPEFESYLGRATDGVSDFIAFDAWDTLVPSARWILSCWAPSGKRVSLAVPLLPKQGATLERGAAGEYDARFRELGRAIVEAGGKNAYLRVGIEFNGDWFPWSAARHPQAYKAYFARVVAALRSAPGANFQIIWNPTLGVLSMAPDVAYPGDSFVDVVALDVYNQSWRSEDDDPQVRFAHMKTQRGGLDWLARFAAAHRKRMAIPEWGTGTRPDGHGYGDDPRFVRAMAAWIKANDVVFHGYWDYNAPDYDARLSRGRYPASAATFRDEFR